LYVGRVQSVGATPVNALIRHWRFLRDCGSN
jgi:hypothetical protein